MKINITFHILASPNNTLSATPSVSITPTPSIPITPTSYIVNGERSAPGD